MKVNLKELGSVVDDFRRIDLSSEAWDYTAMRLKCLGGFFILLLLTTIGPSLFAQQDSAAQMKTLPGLAAAQTTSTTNGDTEEVIPGQSFETIRSIPKRTRAIYGGIAIGCLLLLVIVLRVLKARRA